MAKTKRKTKRKAKAKRSKPSYATLERRVRALRSQLDGGPNSESQGSWNRERSNLLATITNQGHRIQELLSQIPQ